MTLYINCCPRMNSRTDRLARALLKKLGEYEELRLYDEPIRAMDPQRLPHREELLARGELDGEIFRYSHQLDMGISHMLYIFCKFMCKLPVIKKSVLCSVILLLP